MPAKEVVITSLNKSNYSKSEVQHLINSINSVQSIRDPKVDYVKKYDYFLYEAATSSKSRPYVVVKVLKDTVIAIPLSTTKDNLNLMPSKCRVLKEGYFSKQFITVHKDLALRNWVVIYDNHRMVDKAVVALKKYLNESL